MATLSQSQTDALMLAERVTTCFSLVGITFILSTFICSEQFRKPINRLIFFASIGNLGMNVATMIAEAGPAAGQDSHLCQFQATIIQMFLGVDAFWMLCMACNVYLVFFRGYTVPQLKALDYWYLPISYGLALVPAITYLFVSTPSRGKIYGPAVIWCWIDINWDFLRIATLYAIVWVGIAMAAVVYFMAGRVIWQKRKHLEGFMNPFNENPFTNTITTEITITSEDRSDSVHVDPNMGVPVIGYVPYAVAVAADKEEKPANMGILQMATMSKEVAQNEANPEAWLYARVAFIFFVTILITWVPSTANRIYSLVHPENINFGLNLTSALVLPLQGFWNMLVYIVTSKTACKNLYSNGRLFLATRGRKCSTTSDTEMGRLKVHRRQSLGLESDVSSMTALRHHEPRETH